MRSSYPSAPVDRVLRWAWVTARNAMIADRGARRAELAAAKGVIGSGRRDG